MENYDFRKIEELYPKNYNDFTYYICLGDSQQHCDISFVANFIGYFSFKDFCEEIARLTTDSLTFVGYFKKTRVVVKAVRNGVSSAEKSRKSTIQKN